MNNRQNSLFFPLTSELSRRDDVDLVLKLFRVDEIADLKGSGRGGVERWKRLRVSLKEVFPS